MVLMGATQAGMSIPADRRKQQAKPSALAAHIMRLVNAVKNGGRTTSSCAIFGPAQGANHSQLLTGASLQ